MGIFIANSCMSKIEDYEIMTWKSISTLFKVGKCKAQLFGSNTRKYYGIKKGGTINFGQVMRANNLEK